MRSLVILALAAGCYRGAATAPAEPANDARRGTPSHARTALDPLGFLQVDAEMVASLDVAQFRQSTLWARVEPRLLEKAASTIDEFRSACGFDPLPLIQTVAIGMRGLETPQLAAVLVVRGVPRAQMMPCVHKAVARDPGTGTIDRDGVVSVRGAPNEPPVVFAYADGRTVVMLTGHGASPAALRAVLDRGAPLRGSPAFMDMFGRVDTRRTGWFFLNGNSQLFSSARFPSGFRPRAIFGSADATSGLSAKVVMRMPQASDAQSIVGMVQGQLAAMRSLVAKLDVVAEEADVVIDLALTDDQLAMIAGLLGP